MPLVKGPEGGRDSAEITSVQVVVHRALELVAIIIIIIIVLAGAAASYYAHHHGITTHTNE